MKKFFCLLKTFINSLIFITEFRQNLANDSNKFKNMTEDNKKNENSFNGNLNARIENLSKQFSGTSNRNKISKNTSFYPWFLFSNRISPEYELNSRKTRCLLNH